MLIKLLNRNNKIQAIDLYLAHIRRSNFYSYLINLLSPDQINETIITSFDIIISLLLISLIKNKDNQMN